MRSVNPEIQGYGDNMSNYGYLIHSELYHHGVKGMKWGVHRYTNADGSLNEAGKKRYRVNADLSSSASKRGARRRYRDTEIDAWRAAREKAKLKGILNKKERKQYINDTAEGYINKQYKDWFKDEGPLNRTRDESAYRYRKSATRNALGNIGKNALGAAALSTVGIGMFGVSPNQGKIYNDIYKETTRRLQNKKAAQHSALYHHGIKGMRWGIRRYQNEDGSLTELGKRRYGSMSDEKLYRTLKKQVRDKKVQYIRETENPKADWSYRWDTSKVIGPNSKKFKEEADKAYKKYISSNEYKEWEKKLKAAEKWDYDDTYDKRWKELMLQKPKGQPEGSRSARVLKNGKWQFIPPSKGYFQGYGKQASIAKLKDLGYDDKTAEYLASRIARAKETLYDA